MDDTTLPASATTAAPTETTESPTPDGAAAPAAEGSTQQAETPAWVRALEEAPVDELRRHPRFAGIVGSEKQRWQADFQAAEQARLAEEARANAARELEELARTQPVAFADRWLGEQEAKAQRERLQALETNARAEVARNIGASVAQTPEGTEIVNDPERFGRIQARLAGLPDEQVLPAWNQAWVDEIATLRAERKAEAQLASRLERERQAWETEAAANGFVTSARPLLTRGRGAASTDPEPPMSDAKAWNAWYARTTPR